MKVRTHRSLPLNRTITVLVVDDHTDYRETLRSFLDSEADIAVVGEAGDGQHAIALAEELQPDVVLMDIAMPNIGGIEATRQITAAWPACRVVGLSIYTDQKHVDDMMAAGAHSFLFKHNAGSDIVEAIRTAVS